MIPVSEPLLAGAEAKYVAECIETGWISSEGRYLTAFEQAWASYCGAKFGIGVSNGTTALQIAVAALDLDPGSEIILPSFTIISCSLAIVDAGCVPVLVDVDPETWALDLDQVEAKVTEKTRAIMPVHMFGHPVDMPRLMKIAARYNLKVIEDAAEAHGAEVDGRKVGGIGDLATFSFYANKIITTGEGGMVLTSDEELARRLRSLRNLCFKPERRFYHTELGRNYRLTNLQAAIGLAQLERIDDHLTRKRWMAEGYDERLRDLKQLRLPIERPGYKNVYWMYSVVLSDDVPFDAVEFAKLLQQRGVQTRPLFLGMHEQPVFHERGLHLNERYPVTERLARRGLYLPSGLTLTIEQIDAVSDAVRKILS
jgi:perosamine synthetase